MKERLLVVVAEDYLPLRLCVCELLVAMGAAVIEVGNGDELFSVLEREQVDVVVTDVRMSGTSGLDVLRRRRASGDRTPFVLMSGSVAGLDQRVSGCDAVVLLEKPFTEDALEAVVQRAVAMRAA